jgi:DUF4097 and DUF4098 domain-containing protein YvlB
MNKQTGIILGVAVIIVIVVAIGAYVFFISALTPLEQRKDTSTYAAVQNVEIQATTFNGNIEIQTSTSNIINVTYNVEAPEGHLNQISTATTNQTQSQNTLILVAEAKLVNSSGELTVNHKADITLLLPSTGQYNLTLSTLNGNIIKPLLNDTNIVARSNNGYIDIKDDNANSIEASSLNGNVNISLLKGTLFQVDATSANGQVTYQGIAMNTTIQSGNHLKGNTTDGTGHLNLTISSANGNVTIEYFTQ